MANDVTADSIFGAVAQAYYDKGLIPLYLGKFDWAGKAAQAAHMTNWQNLSRDPPEGAGVYDRIALKDMVARYGDRNIGLACGQLVSESLQFGAVDIDSDEHRSKVERALPGMVCGKTGSKGTTWFVLAPSDMGTRPITTSRGKTMMDLLLVKSQVAIPPSIHPKTKMPYTWNGVSLLDIHVRDLPIIGPGFVIECEEISRDKDVYFNGGTLDNGTEITGINHMQWAGIGGGGNTYDSRLRAVAHMVATGWQDGEIVARILRAQREAVEEAGEVFDWPDGERETRRMIDDARKKGFDQPSTGGKAAKLPIERMMANWLATQYSQPYFYGGEIFSYADGWFAKHHPDSMGSKIVNNFHAGTDAKAQAGVKTFCLVHYKEDFGLPGSTKVCLNNGTLDIESVNLIPWSADHELLYKLDIDWDPQAKCPVYDKFVEWVFAGDKKAITLWNEWCGLTLVDDTTFQKMLFLLGETGANGKSTLASLLRSIHNTSAVSSIPITGLNNERNLTSLVGCLLNVSSEQSRVDSMSDTILKQITGGDPIPIRRLFREVENNVVLKVRFLALANEMPSTNDTGDPMRRRLMVLTCPNQLPEDQRDSHLLDKLKAESAGILVQWAKSLLDLRGRGHFDIPDSSKEAVDRYLTSNDYCKTWSRFRMRPPTSTADFVETMPAYSDYAEWAKNSGIRSPLRLHEFVARMERIGFKVAKRKIGNREEVEGFEAKFDWSSGGKTGTF